MEKICYGLAMLDDFLLCSLNIVQTVCHSVLFHPIFNQAIFYLTFKIQIKDISTYLP